MARSLPIALRTDPETGLPIAPTSAEWAALTPTQQDDVFWALFDALNAYEELLPPEGSPHSGAQRDAINRMEMDFRRMNRGIFLAVNMMVQYAGERPFAPDLLAVCDVPLHDRNGWIVEREGKGPDFVLEVLFSGDRKKDLKDNVVWFARLGIPEYFVFDGARRQVLGYRLESVDARQYSRIVPQFGRLPSAVLGIELRRRRPAFTVDLAFALTAASDRTAELLNLMASVASFLNRNRWLVLPRDPVRPELGRVRWEMDPEGDFRTNLHGQGDVRVFTCGFVVRGFDLDEGLPMDLGKAVAAGGAELSTVAHGGAA